MRLGCDYLNEPIYLSDEYVNVLSIESKPLFRRFMKSMLCGEPESENFIFSKDFKPLSFNKNICFIHDCYNLTFSPSFIKKIYEDLAEFCNSDMLNETFEFKKIITDFIDRLIKEFEFDFTYNEEISLQDIFKIQNIKPDTQSFNGIDALYEYIILMQKYSPVRCFVVLGLHMNFSENELEPFYKELIDRKVRLLIVESVTDFAPSQFEKLTVIDEDLCEIVAKDE